MYYYAKRVESVLLEREAETGPALAGGTAISSVSSLQTPPLMDCVRNLSISLKSERSHTPPTRRPGRKLSLELLLMRRLIARMMSLYMAFCRSLRSQREQRHRLVEQLSIGGGLR